MRTPISLASTLLCLFMVTNVNADQADLDKLGWLAGCWAPEAGEAGSVEHWLPLAGGTMLGVGRTVKDGKTVSYEFLQIRVSQEGKAVYIARPSGQEEASFTALNLTDDSVTFENLQHDFPQRIIYRLSSDNKLVARAEGLRDGELRGVDFPMKRVPCDKLGDD